MAFVLSALQLYSDEDYVHNYLGCGPNGDTGAIPIMGSIMISMFFTIIHILTHVFFILTTKVKGNKFKIGLGFYKHDKIITHIVKGVFYLFSAFLVYDYVAAFYKFYLYEFISFIFMTSTVIIYSVTISNIIETPDEQTEVKLNAT